MLSRALILRTAALKPVERTIRRSRLFRPLVSRFIAGDTLDEAILASVGLLNKGLRVTLDYLGENTHSEAEAVAAKDTFVRMLDRIGATPEVQSTRLACPPEPLNISIKLTQCGLDIGDDLAERNYREVVAAADGHGNFVRVDMEASAYTERTISIFRRVFAEHKNTGTVLQAYLRRTDADVETMISLGARVRLCKGAYLEPGSVAFEQKRDVDEAYMRQAKRLLKEGQYPAIATHDERIVRELREFVAAERIDKNRFEFQMLLGIRRDLQDKLRQEGFNVRIYVPFGERWYPYFTRRLAERPANSLFILRSLFRG